MNRPLSPQSLRDLLQFRARTFSYHSGDIQYRIATPEDDSTLRAFLRDNSMESWVQMTLEREPDFFAGADLLGHDMVILARRDQAAHDTVGMGTWGLRPVYVNGRLQNLGYVSQLRVKPEFRNRIRVLKTAHRALQTFTEGIGALWSFTSIASENSKALRVLNANLRGMPVYTPQGQYLTLAMSTARIRRGAVAADMRSACEADVPALAAFHNDCASQWQFAPGLSQQWLLSLNHQKGLTLDDFLLWSRDGDICACLAVWDQRRVKQTVARGYRVPINLLRRPYNLFARLSGRIELPAVGNPLQQAYLAFAAFGELSDEEILGVVCAGLARARGKGARVAVIGQSTRNPLAERLRRHFRAVTFRSEIETVNWPGQPMPALDGRPAQPDVALL